jgi:BMFP domain-containing protein YqiC
MSKKTPTQVLRNLKAHLDQLSEGNHSAADVAASLNDWARESAELIKVRVHEEVETTVTKMGFIKREEYDLLLARVKKLESQRSTSEKKPAKKSVAKKTAPTRKKATS